MTGRYLLRDDYLLDITTTAGQLTLTVPDQLPILLLPLSNGHYRHPAIDLEVWFPPTADQRHTMHLRQENIIQTATRTDQSLP